jgi:hypothetical protein
MGQAPSTGTTVFKSIQAAWRAVRGHLRRSLSASPQLIGSQSGGSPVAVRLPGPDNETIPPSSDPYGDVARAGNVTEASGAGVTRVVRRVVTVADVDFAACCTTGGPRSTCATIGDWFAGPIGRNQPGARLTQLPHRLVNLNTEDVRAQNRFLRGGAGVGARIWRKRPRNGQ